MKKVAKIILSSFCLFAFTTVVYHYYKQDALIFKNKETPKEYVFESDHPFEEFYLKTKDGADINVLHFKQSGAKGIVYFLHGAGSNLQRSIPKAPTFLDQGYDVVMIDYRGFGKSSVKPFSEEGLFEDAQTGYDYVKKHYSEDQIIICGHSLGSSFATWVAAKNHPKLLILEAPFYSMVAAACYTKPYLPEWMVKLMLRYHLHTDEWIINVKAPIYIFHGTDDRIVPYNHALLLVQKMKQRGLENQVTLFTMPGWGHQNIHKHSLYRKFFETVLPASSYGNVAM